MRNYRGAITCLRRDDRAQSAAVGTILGIMVVLTLLTVVTTKWIPVWVEGREADHAQVVDAQFAEFKKTVDQQALIGTPGASVGNPFTLGQPGVPIFAPGSSGTIYIGAYGAGQFQNRMQFENASHIISLTAYGGIKYTTLNTRFVQQSHLYEFGSVIINQSDGQLLKTGPALLVDNVSGNVQLRVTMIALNGDGTTFSGDDTIGVKSQLLFAPAVTERNLTTPQPFWLNITSESAQAWQVYFNKTLSTRLGAGQYDVTYTAATNLVSVKFNSVNKVIISYEVFQVDLDIA